MTTDLVGFDYETHLIGPEALAPRAVCLSVFENNTESSFLASRADGDLEDTMRELLESDFVIVGANTAFDLAVAVHESPAFFPYVFEKLSKGQVSDVLIREKLLNLADTGDLEYLHVPGSDKPRPVSYSLGALASQYLGITLEKAKSGKKGDEDAWRLNYSVLEETLVEDWPKDAVDYAINDAIYPCRIYELQEKRRAELKQVIGFDPLKTERFRVWVDFALYLMSCRGVAIDPEKHKELKDWAADELSEDKLDLLFESGILRPAIPARPFAKDQRFCKAVSRKECVKPACDCPPKMTKAKKASKDKKVLFAIVEDLAKSNSEVELRYTDKGNLQVDAAWLADFAHHSPVLQQLQHREKMQKIVNTDLPRLEWPKGSGVPAKVVHPSFDVLKATGRTSSFASKLNPSMNCQNPHPKIRDLIVPRPGYLLYSCDFSAMELVTLAQTCYSLFGHSQLREVINQGWDSHAFLGSYIAYYLDEDFAESCDEEGISGSDPEALYKAFVSLKSDPATKDFYAHYRKFAKPTGLGYPGGLGSATFVQYAHATYGVDCDEQTAKELKEVWKRAFPEMGPYLDHVNKNLRDTVNEGFCYRTPLGMYRAGANYCAAANGLGLQSPGAEGALLSVAAVSAATHADPDSPLFDDEKGVRHRMLMFLHDEIIGEAREDCAHEVACEVAKLMVDSMSKITPDVKPGAEPVLMRRWDKKAEPVFDSCGRLIPWEPK